MANPLLVAIAVAVPVVLVIGVGGGYWYFKADRVVGRGEHRGFAWRVSRVNMQYTAEVRSPVTTGNPDPQWSSVLGEVGGDMSPWSTADAAQAQAIAWVDAWLGPSTIQAPVLPVLKLVSV